MDVSISFTALSDTRNEATSIGEDGAEENIWIQKG
jgi:hypothetical protein